MQKGTGKCLENKKGVSPMYSDNEPQQSLSPTGTKSRRAVSGDASA